jgi:hypothetical protein
MAIYCRAAKNSLRGTALIILRIPLHRIVVIFFIYQNYPTRMCDLCKGPLDKSVLFYSEILLSKKKS